MKWKVRYIDARQPGGRDADLTADGRGGAFLAAEGRPPLHLSARSFFLLDLDTDGSRVCLGFCHDRDARIVIDGEDVRESLAQYLPHLGIAPDRSSPPATWLAVGVTATIALAIGIVIWQ